MEEPDNFYCSTRAVLHTLKPEIGSSYEKEEIKIDDDY